MPHAGLPVRHEYSCAGRHTARQAPQAATPGQAPEGESGLNRFATGSAMREIMGRLICQIEAASCQTTAPAGCWDAPRPAVTLRRESDILPAPGMHSWNGRSAAAFFFFCLSRSWTATPPWPLLPVTGKHDRMRLRRPIGQVISPLLRTFQEQWACNEGDDATETRGPATCNSLPSRGRRLPRRPLRGATLGQRQLRDASMAQTSAPETD